jgi:hypothetical protein
VETPDDPLPVRALSRAVHFLTIAEESWALLALFIAANACITVYLVAGTPRLAFGAFAAAMATGALLLVVSGSLAWKIYERSAYTHGIVIEQKVDIRSGPGAENVTVFTVHEGIKLRVRSESGGWYQVSLPNGWNGWVRKGALRVL